MSATTETFTGHELRFNEDFSRAVAIETPRVISEPPTYHRRSENSYFRDLYSAALDADTTAIDRLERHGREMEHEQRVNPSANTSTLVPPSWLIDETATANRPLRVLSNLVQQFPLPPGVRSINVPRLTTGTSTQPEQDLGPVSDTDFVDEGVSSIVTTIAGQSDVSQQLLDQSPPGARADHVIFRDLTAAYDAQLELQMINGSGVGENLLGLLNQIPASNQITYTSAAPTGSAEIGPIGQAMAAIGDHRFVHPEVWLMRTARWAWLTSSEDANGMPFLIADWGPSGQGLNGLGVQFDNAIPATLGTGGNQDAILCARPSDIMLFESDLKTLVTPEPLSGTMQVRFSLHGSAAMINLHKFGHASVTGSGLAVQSGY